MSDDNSDNTNNTDTNNTDGAADDCTFHMEVTFSCHNDSDYSTDEWYLALDKYEDAFPYYSAEDSEKLYNTTIHSIENTCSVCLNKIGKTFQYFPDKNDPNKVKIHASCKNKADQGKCNTQKIEELKMDAGRILQRPSMLPKYSSGCHGVQHGICFTFKTKENVEFAFENMLKEDFFVNFEKQHPKFYFKIYDDLTWGIYKNNEVIQKIS